MSEHIERTIADCESKIAQLTHVVEQLRWFQREFPHSAAAIEKKDEAPAKRTYTWRTKVRKVKAVRGRPRAANGNRPTDRPTDRAKPGPRPTVRRSLPDVNDPLTVRVLAELRRRSPQSPRELIAATSTDRAVLRAHLTQMASAGLVDVSGATTNRQVALASKGRTAAPAKAETPEEASCTRCEHDQSAHEADGIGRCLVPRCGCREFYA